MKNYSWTSSMEKIQFYHLHMFFSSVRLSSSSLFQCKFYDWRFETCVILNLIYWKSKINFEFTYVMFKLRFKILRKDCEFGTWVSIRFRFSIENRLMIWKVSLSISFSLYYNTISYFVYDCLTHDFIFSRIHKYYIFFLKICLISSECFS